MAESKTGISKTVFAVGLIAAILASSLISVVAMTQLSITSGLKGEKGDKGDTGATGATGPQGPAGPVTTFAKWILTWYTLTGDLQWGASIGTSTWGAIFDHNFGTGPLYLGYDDYIGFKAVMTINMKRDNPIHFAIGGDDGVQLYVDADLWIDNWGNHAYSIKEATGNLPQGFHTLTLWYYDFNTLARVSFNCDPDILMWNT